MNPKPIAWTQLTAYLSFYIFYKGKRGTIIDNDGAFSTPMVHHKVQGKCLHFNNGERPAFSSGILNYKDEDVVFDNNLGAWYRMVEKRWYPLRNRLSL